MIQNVNISFMIYKTIQYVKSENVMQWLPLQLLKAWDAEVTAVASKAAEDLLLSLGADIIIDYKQPGYKEDMMKVQGYCI